MTPRILAVLVSLAAPLLAQQGAPDWSAPLERSASPALSARAGRQANVAVTRGRDGTAWLWPTFVVQRVEARQAILEIAAASRGIPMGEQQLRQLAKKSVGTTAQLLRSLAEHQLSASEPSLADTSLAESTRPPLPVQQIIAVVARYFKLTQASLRSSARRKSLVYARSVAVHLARVLTDLSYAQIGASLGRRDHTTIMHAARSIQRRLASDAAVQRDVEELKRILTAI